MIESFKEYLEFIKESKIIEGAIMFFLGSMIKTLMMQILREVIIPVTKGKVEKLNINYKKYVAEIIQIVVTSYLLFLLHKGVKNI
jgi:large-conductance mechanosensitive channel